MKDLGTAVECKRVRTGSRGAVHDEALHDEQDLHEDGGVRVPRARAGGHHHQRLQQLRLLLRRVHHLKRIPGGNIELPDMGHCSAPDSANWLFWLDWLPSVMFLINI